MGYKKFNVEKASLADCLSKQEKINTWITETFTVLDDTYYLCYDRFLLVGENEANVKYKEIKKKYLDNQSSISYWKQKLYELKEPHRTFDEWIELFFWFDNHYPKKKKSYDDDKERYETYLSKELKEEKSLAQSLQFYEGIVNDFNRLHNSLNMLTRLEDRIKYLKRKDSVPIRVKNRAARNIQEKRNIAKQLDVLRNEYCPYCGVVLDYDYDDIHLDHIYPISKGGDSVPSNLVYVCSECNMKKGNDTLRNFIIKYDLDRNEIEEYLDSLGKDF